jgi:UDP-N-acetylmuramoylalanine--D-glutamate ligase
VAFFSVHERVPQGAYLRGDTLVLAQQGREVDICNRRDLLLRGTHNVCNVLAACAVAAVMGVQADLMAKVARTFAGVEHRLELVGEIDGVRYFNDSIATSPERAIAALASFDEPVLLLAGGRDKHLPWETWAHLVQRKATMVITFGEAATLVEHALRQLEGATPPVRSAGSLERAVELAHDAARPGQVVLFSPGGTSFDAYRDYVDRGEAFKTMVGRLRDAHEHSPDEGRNDR